MKRSLLITTITCLTVFCSFSQSNSAKLKQFQSKTKAQVTVNETTQTPEFIRFSKSNPLKVNGGTIKQKALSFITSYQDVLGVSANNYSLEAVTKDNYGFQQAILKQHVNNVPVFDGQLKLHFDANKNITAVNGNIIPISNIDTNTNLTQTEANALAIAFVNSQNLNHSGVPLFVVKNELMVFRKGLVSNTNQGDFLTYVIEVRNNTDVREYLYIDAHSGKLVEQFTGMAHALDRVVYENNTNNPVWQEGNPFPGTLDLWQRNEVVASEHVYHFFENAFGYVSYNGADAQMKTINNNPNISCPNATWNGFTANYCNGTATDDVIAHEWGHAYTEFTSKLIYAYQSGALNEGYSDIWGETIDLMNNYQDEGENLSLRTTCNNSLRWQIGEDASAFGGAIRDMYFPTCDGYPGKVTDSQYRCGTSDSGGVHSNSGVPNHAYALLVDGGTYNGQSITGIGFTKAAHIFWRAQKEYLTATSDFSVFANALTASANDLLGVNLEGLSVGAPVGLSGEMITAADINQLNNVIIATELTVNPDACNYLPLLTETTSLCTNAIDSPLYKEDWESGMSDWLVTQTPVNPATWESRDWAIETSLPKGRAGQAIFGVDPINGNCNTSLQNGVIRLKSPIITAPSTNVNDYKLAFNHNVSTEFQWDGGNIKYSINGATWVLLPQAAFTVNAYNSTLKTTADGNDNPMQSEVAFTGSDEGGNTGSWATSVVDLSTLGFSANDTIQFRFEVGTDGCNGAVGWYVDEIYVYSCSNALSTESFNYLDENLTVSPNPSNGVFTLSNAKNIDVKEAQVYDMNGRLIKTIHLNSNIKKNQIQLNELSSGVYFMKVNTASTNKTFKIIKN